uniref:F-box domain-containing protein n=1 Tax=Heterorhabditis bacteriophora TaxID=37862 RepID=A0A1I7WJW8_HETBA
MISTTSETSTEKLKNNNHLHHEDGEETSAGYAKTLKKKKILKIKSLISNLNDGENTSLVSKLPIPRSILIFNIFNICKFISLFLACAHSSLNRSIVHPLYGKLWVANICQTMSSPVQLMMNWLSWTVIREMSISRCGQLEAVYTIKVIFQVVQKEFVKRHQKLAAVIREKNVLASLTYAQGGHPFVTRLYCTFQDSERLCK